MFYLIGREADLGGFVIPIAVTTDFNEAKSFQEKWNAHFNNPIIGVLKIYEIPQASDEQIYNFMPGLHARD
jgi:hypothetical protein